MPIYTNMAFTQLLSLSYMSFSFTMAGYFSLPHTSLSHLVLLFWKGYFLLLHFPEQTSSSTLSLIPGH